MNSIIQQAHRHLWIAVSCHLAFGLLDCRSEENIAVHQTRQDQEVVSMVAQGILNPQSIIIVGETRLDSLVRAMALADPRQVSSVATTLNLTGVTPIAVFRGNVINKDQIWIQTDPYTIRSREKYFYHLPNLTQEGVWFFILKPVDKLPRAMSLSSSDLSKAISEVDRTVTPYELAKKLKVDSWLNKNTWYGLAYEFSAFRIAGKSIRDVPLPDSLSQLARDQIAGDNKRIRQVQQAQKPREREFFITDGQLIEIELLIKMFQDPSRPPSIGQLLALKSEFSEAVLRELAKTPTADLEAGLRQLKESIPKSTLEKIFKQE